MNEQFKSPYAVHCFICTRCENGQKLRDDVKALCKLELSDHAVRVNASGCLGMCDSSIASAFYPQGQYKVGWGQNQAPEVVAMIKNLLGQPLE